MAEKNIEFMEVQIEVMERIIHLDEEKIKDLEYKVRKFEDLREKNIKLESECRRANEQLEMLQDDFILLEDVNNKLRSEKLEMQKRVDLLSKMCLFLLKDLGGTSLADLYVLKTEEEHD